MLLIKNVNVFNTYFRKFNSANVYIKDGRFYYIDFKKNSSITVDEIIEGENKYMIPGLIDIHMHIESSMVTPNSFSHEMAKNGVTTLVAEPHEIANVMGIRGVTEMINAGRDSLIDIYYGIPSSVPSTSSDLETTGGEISYSQMIDLMQEENVICVGEVMNYKKVIEDGNDLEITKFLNYIQENFPNYIVEGHCPKLMDLDLAKFLFLGINADHTEHTLEEIKDRFEQGMFVEIQEKMLRSEILDFIISNNLYDFMSFVTDDVMPDDLYKKGHLNYVLQKAIDLGFPKEYAIYCATHTPAVRMNLRDRGSIAPGKIADFSILNSLEDWSIDKVYKNGNNIYQKDANLEYKQGYKFPKDFYNSIKLKNINKSCFVIEVPADKIYSKNDRDFTIVRAMNVKDGSTHIEEVELEIEVKGGILQWEDSPHILGAVFNRYSDLGKCSFGILTGDIIKKGAAATTWFHDSHNLFVMGKTAEEMTEVAIRVISNKGGLAVVNDNGEFSELILEVGGIMSDKPVKEVALDLAQVRKALINLGYKHYNPIMSIGTIGLPVSPYLKLTDKGLVDVIKGEIVPLYI